MKRLHFFLSGLIALFLFVGAGVNSPVAAKQGGTNATETSTDQGAATISRAKLLTINHVFAGLGEYFAYEGLKFTVNSYTFAYVPKAGGAPYMAQVEGSKLTPQIISKLHNAHAGDLIVVTEVHVTGPTGNMVLSGKTLTVR